MEQGVPPGVRDGAIHRPSLLLRALYQRHVHVPLHRRVVRHDGHGAQVHDRRLALVEHVVAAQDGQAVICRGGDWAQ